MTHAPHKIEVACNCGKLRGHGLSITPKTGRHITCMCKDCQAFARFLGRADILDQNGGTEIFQITPSQIALETGLEHLASMQLSPKGAMRWYASCCNTPIANTTPSAAFPFAGVFCAFISPGDTGARDTALGPIKTRYYGRDGYGNIPQDAQHRITLGAIIESIFWMLGNKIRGRTKPTPFFSSDGTPIAAPKILTKDERAQFTTQNTTSATG